MTARSISRRRLLLVLTATVVVTTLTLAIAGCGGDDKSSPQTSSTVLTSSSMPGEASSTSMQTTGSTQATGGAGSSTTVASETTSTTAAGGTTTTGSSTGSTSSSSSTSTSTTGSTSAGAKIFGKVLDTDNAPVAGATVKVVYNATDTHYRASGDNTIGTATTDAQGNYQISVGSLATGSIVDVSVVAQDHTSVLAYGKYDETQEQVDFINFGKTGGDRRMPVGDQMPPLPFEGLLPD